MKAWTVFLVDNKEKVAVFVNSDKEGIKVLKSIYGDVPIKWLGWARYMEYDKKIYDENLCPVDKMLASGFLNTYYARELGLKG